MIRWRTGTVTETGRQWPDAVELSVRLVDGPSPGETVKALAYTRVVGSPEPGDRVLLNVTALERGLGTGGYALVVAIPDRLPPDPDRGPGHLVKARYTPLQTMVLGADEQESADHEILREADELGGCPVVVADLHSALPAILLGARLANPDLRVSYVMTDGGALPIAFSRSVAECRSAGLLTATVTAGQAYGGDAEAVTVHTALLAARLVQHADLIVVTQGPGNLGTGTRWGFSGVQTGEAVNAAGVLSGRPVASLRISQADARARHRGVSHHSLTTYGRVAMMPADVVLPDLPGEFGDLVRDAVAPLAARHRLVRVSAPELGRLESTLAESPVTLRTMGRDYAGDPAYFIAAAAAGWHASGLVDQP